MLTKLKQLLCHHRYVNNNPEVIDLAPNASILRFRTYCVKCGKSYEVSVPYSSIFGKAESIRPSIQRCPRSCSTCDKTDGLCYTSYPPQVRCAITGKLHFYNDKCDLEESSTMR